jgi:ATPase subunit of ABC transporter with duplicated ATPase domains
MSHAIVVDDLRFAWPDGHVLFDGLSFVVGPGRTGLVGANGSGKSALLRLLAGELVPAGGSVQVAGSLGHLRQDLTLDAHLPVDEVLGVARARRALLAIERGEATGAQFAAVGTTGTSRSASAPSWTGSAWTTWTWTSASARCRAARRSCSAWPPSSSGGPTCCCWTSRPTTSTWGSARQLAQVLASYRGALLVASHDLPFLRTVGVTRRRCLDGRLTQIDPPP